MMLNAKKNAKILTKILAAFFGSQHYFILVSFRFSLRHFYPSKRYITFWQTKACLVLLLLMSKPSARNCSITLRLFPPHAKFPLSCVTLGTKDTGLFSQICFTGKWYVCLFELGLYYSKYSQAVCISGLMHLSGHIPYSLCYYSENQVFGDVTRLQLNPTIKVVFQAI